MVSSEDALFFATSVLASATIALAVITGLYLWETRRMRKIAQSPSFSLEPDRYSSGGTFHQVNLVNTGQSANDLFVDCEWDRTTKKFHIVSLSKDGRARLDLPMEDIVAKGMKLAVEIKCKDAYGEDSQSKLEVDFSKATLDDREGAYQYNVLSEIEERLRDISNKRGLLG